VRRQRGRQVAPCGHPSTVGQRFLRLVPRDDQEERRRISGPARAVAREPRMRTTAPRLSSGRRAPARTLGLQRLPRTRPARPLNSRHPARHHGRAARLPQRRHPCPDHPMTPQPGPPGRPPV
jgi:hypothetical protein